MRLLLPGKGENKHDNSEHRHYQHCYNNNNKNNSKINVTTRRHEQRRILIPLLADIFITTDQPKLTPTSTIYGRIHRMVMLCVSVWGWWRQIRYGIDLIHILVYVCLCLSACVCVMIIILREFAIWLNDDDLCIEEELFRFRNQCVDFVGLFSSCKFSSFLSSFLVFS